MLHRDPPFQKLGLISAALCSGEASASGSAAVTQQNNASAASVTNPPTRPRRSS
jgi:hypothetical protein